ncbi:hypothetical protein RT97_04985 [Variovorax paradoxus]|uniref:Uncharacterized protein n=1 Tax=Variovorax paradoxus TaxID=34073 RepID=A0A0D0LAG2_VARPD|nr:hypothetical protein RT97_04985 [Variovorax paradoxus]
MRHGRIGVGSVELNAQLPDSVEGKKPGRHNIQVQRSVRNAIETEIRSPARDAIGFEMSKSVRQTTA